ncbi:MAG: hypothetical protein E7620_03265 [Ruminococcaceae bacterium]|nr:hypothetical protein [Oscillospiraceae bacterium]
MRDELFQVLQHPNGGDTLSAQKETVKTYAKSQLIGICTVALIGAILLIVSFAVRDPAQGWAIRFGALPIMLLMLVIIGFTYSKRRQYDQTMGEIELSTTETKTVSCVKLRFMKHRESKYNTKLAGILLWDEAGVCYFYIFPEMIEGNIGIGRNPYRTLRELLLGKTVTLHCYRGTNAVQAIY